MGVPQDAAQLRQERGGRAVHGQVGLDCHVIAGAEAGQPFLPGGGQQRGAGGVHDLRERLPLPGHGPVGQVFGHLHVRLVEGVDPQHRPGGGRGRLAPVHFPAYVARVVHRDAHYGMAGGLQGFQEGGRAGRVVAGQSQVNEQPVRTVGVATARRFVGHRNQAGSPFAGAFRQQLLHPRSAGGQGGGGQESDLVPAGPGGLPHHRPQFQARIVRRGTVRAAFFHHLRRPGQQTGRVHAQQGGRNQPESGQGRIASPHLERSEKHPAKPPLLRQGFQTGTGVGYGDEPAPRLGDDPSRPLPEATEQGQGFQGAPRFGGHHKQGAFHVQAGRGRPHRRRVGAVQNRQIRVTGGGPKDFPKHFRGQAGAAHPQQDHPVAPGANLLGESAPLRQGLRGGGRGPQPSQPVGQFGDGLRRPQGMVALPQPGPEIGPLPSPQTLRNRLGQIRQRIGNGGAHKVVAPFIKGLLLLSPRFFTGGLPRILPTD